ncbi:hypothetical protein ES703_82089 [subsurface metagenome]
MINFTRALDVQLFLIVDFLAKLTVVTNKNNHEDKYGR